MMIRATLGLYKGGGAAAASKGFIIPISSGPVPPPTTIMCDDVNNGIISFDTVDQVVAGVHTIDKISVTGSVGDCILCDSNGRILSKIRLTTFCAVVTIPIRRTVSGIKVFDISTDQIITVFLNKG